MRLAAALVLPQRDDIGKKILTRAGEVAVARVHGLLDLAPTADCTRLATLVAAAGDTDLVLTAADEAAYNRTVDRFNNIWALRNGLDFFLY